mmetsp:Transcript_11233/g.31278  ORF Transcript_11233/g.31278 Transcript_11233/m.31278 type:complete len:99 (-) Transcript_11233:547-843(-)
MVSHSYSLLVFQDTLRYCKSDKTYSLWTLSEAWKTRRHCLLEAKLDRGAEQFMLTEKAFVQSLRFSRKVGTFVFESTSSAGSLMGGFRGAIKSDKSKT